MNIEELIMTFREHSKIFEKNRIDRMGTIPSEYEPFNLSLALLTMCEEIRALKEKNDQN
jgi:hypothetical protein